MSVGSRLRALLSPLFGIEDEVNKALQRPLPRAWVARVQELAADLPDLEGDYPPLPEPHGEMVLGFYGNPAHHSNEAHWAAAVLINASIAVRRWVPVTVDEMLDTVEDAVIPQRVYFPSVWKTLMNWVDHGLCGRSEDGTRIWPSPELVRIWLELTPTLTWTEPRNYSVSEN